jgi:hypothetical protein
MPIDNVIEMLFATAHKILIKPIMELVPGSILSHSIFVITVYPRNVS